MLCAPDAAVVDRDRDIPGLATLLDVDAFATVLRAATPDIASMAVRPAYLRYKPRTSCLAGFVVENGTSTRYVHAIAYAPSRRIVHAPAAVPANLNFTIRWFPDDRKLGALGRLFDPPDRAQLVDKLLRRGPASDVAAIDTLAYKPERRYVGLLSGDATRFVLKLYGPGAAAARAVHRDVVSRGPLRVARCIGRSRRHRALAFEWLSGERLRSLIATGAAGPRAITDVGLALAELHRQLQSAHVSAVPQYDDFLATTARSVAALDPSRADRVTRITRAAARALQDHAADVQPIHGDFYADQVLVGDDVPAILDLDHAGWGDPALDAANLIAHLEYEVIIGNLRPDTRDAIGEALLASYEETTGRSIAPRIPVAVAVNLLRLATRPFRTRVCNWDERIRALLDRAEMLLRQSRVPRRQGAAPDEIPAAALNRSYVGARLAHVPAMNGHRPVLVTAVRVARHKPGRRALIEYDVSRSADGQVRETVLGKVRAKGIDERTFRLVEALARDGFDDESRDGISVPQPLGMIPEARMWLQRRVPVTPARARVTRAADLPSPTRVAEVANKLHRSGVAPTRTHSCDDELAILRERMSLLAASRPHLAIRLDALVRGCSALLASLPCAQPCGIHRDFHPGQLLVHGDRVYLLDLDMYAWGDPALDIGNFLAHVAELSLRTHGDPARTTDYERALVDRYLTLNRDVSAVSIAIYRVASLARLVQISRTFADRRATTLALLEFCERELSGIRYQGPPAVRIAGTL